MKLITLLHRNIINLFKKYHHHHHHQWQRTLASTTHHQQQKSTEIDRTMASIRSISSNPCISLLGICRNIDSLKKIHALLLLHGLPGELLIETKLVSLYGSFGFVGFARSVFDRIRKPDFYSWKVMIRWYFLNDMYAEIIPFYICMRKCLNEYDNVVFSIVLKACTELRDVDVGKMVHNHVVKVGNPDGFVLTCLVDMYAKCEEIEWSRYVFDKIPDRNVVCWTSMIVGYVQNNCSEEGLILFNKMRHGGLVEGNQHTLGSLVTACTKLGALHQGKWVHGYMIKNNVDLNSFLITGLLDMYVKCGEIRDARLIFNELCSNDLVSWTAMIVGYTQRGYPNDALKLFMDKKLQGMLPNSITAATVLSACGKSCNSYMGRSVHGLGITIGLEDASVKNALVDMYAKCHMIDDARYIFETVSEKNIIAWNSIICGYSQNGLAYKAFLLFHRMRLENFSPDAITLVSIVSACATIGSLRVGSSLHAFATKEGLLSSNVYVGTAILNFYAKCGDAKSAREVFNEMGDKNTVTWSAMISGYGIQGDSNESLVLFNDMLKEQVKPNEAVFTAILSACSHTGNVGEGWNYFNSMCRNNNFSPSMNHYACMVDLLARSGRLEEALDFIEKMPVQPSVSLFGAFLHGCGLHSRFDFAEVAMKRMEELYDIEACYHVLMSNLHALGGKWSQADQERRLMRHKHLIKSPGHSLVDSDIDNGLTSIRMASLS